MKIPVDEFSQPIMSTTQLAHSSCLLLLRISNVRNHCLHKCVRAHTLERETTLRFKAPLANAAGDLSGFETWIALRRPRERRSSSLRTLWSPRASWVDGVFSHGWMAHRGRWQLVAAGNGSWQAEFVVHGAHCPSLFEDQVSGEGRSRRGICGYPDTVACSLNWPDCRMRKHRDSPVPPHVSG